MQKANGNNNNSITNNSDFRILGILLLIVTVTFLLLERVLRTGWLTMMILPLCGLLFIIGGIRMSRFGIVISGCLLVGLGSGISIALGQLRMLTWQERMGYGLILFSLSWLGITFFSLILGRRVIWWPLLLTGIIGGASIPLIFTEVTILDFEMFISIGLGLAFLLWGIFEKTIGLIIPGSLLITTGPGIYFPWKNFVSGNGLTPTGEMLVWLSLGWLLIIFFSKIINDQFVWWPLIPGGVLLMVGWGLYIGGNPQSAATFISNSSSIVLIIVGLYLLLIKKGINK